MATIFHLNLITICLLGLSTLGFTQHSNIELWEVYIEDWGGYNIDGSRDTPYDGDGNGSELYALAIIDVDGYQSSWAWAGCRHDCYEDRRPYWAPDGWGNARLLLAGRVLWRGWTSSNPSIRVNLEIWENDDKWPEWVDNPGNGFKWSDVPYGKIAAAGESIAVMAGVTNPWVAAGAAAVVFTEKTVRFFSKENPDDKLWDFSATFRTEGTKMQKFRVPGHESIHWIKVRVRKLGSQ